MKDYTIEPVTPLQGTSGAKSGFAQNLNTICGFSSMDGYKITTDKHLFFVLIDNGQSCCEDWGYLSSDDDLEYYIEADLVSVDLVDSALNQKVLDASGEYGYEEGGIKFINFKTSKGVLQLAVYNAHNGYYGHGIVFAKDQEIILNDTL